MNKLIFIVLLFVISCQLKKNNSNTTPFEDSLEQELLDSRFNYISYLKNDTYILLEYEEDYIVLKYLTNIWEFDLYPTKLNFFTFDIVSEDKTVGRLIIRDINGDVNEIELFIECNSVNVSNLCGDFKVFKKRKQNKK